MFYASFQKEETFKTLQYHLVIDSAQVLFVGLIAATLIANFNVFGCDKHCMNLL